MKYRIYLSNQAALITGAKTKDEAVQKAEKEIQGYSRVDFLQKPVRLGPTTWRVPVCATKIAEVEAVTTEEAMEKVINEKGLSLSPNDLIIELIW